MTPEYQITEQGKYVGLIVPYPKCVELHEKQGYTDAEYRAVVENRNTIAAQLDKALEDLGEAGREIFALRTERESLKDQLEVLEVELKKVELPEAIAEAIDSFKTDGKDVDEIVYWLTRISKGTALRDTTLLLRRYAETHGLNLIKALINDYTVAEEPTTEDKIRQRVEEIMKDTGPWDDPAEVAAEVTQAVREILAEDRQQEQN